LCYLYPVAAGICRHIRDEAILRRRTATDASGNIYGRYLQHCLGQVRVNPADNTWSQAVMGRKDASTDFLKDVRPRYRSTPNVARIGAT